jgi:peptidyl-prolyl cis-trans isomerase D
MLRSLREGAKSGFLKIILFGFLVMAVGGLVLMDVQGFFRGGVPRSAVAKIGKDQLSVTDFDRMLRRILANQNINAEQAYQFGFINQILQAEIANNLLFKAAHDMGIYISDAQIANQVNDLIKPLVTADLSKKEALKRVLLSQGMSENEFIEAIRKETTNNLLRNVIQVGSTSFSTKEGYDLYMYENENRTIKTIFLAHDLISEVEPAEEEVLQALYVAGKEKNAIPETRNFSLVILKEDLLEDTLEISEEELRKTYDENIDIFSLPEQRKIEQAILTSQSTADNVVTKLNAGLDLKKAIEDETNSSEGYMGENVFQKEGLFEEIAEQVFLAETNAVIGPVQSALGWHVLILNEILPPSVEPYEEVKTDIEKDLMQTLLMDEMFALANTVDDRLAGGETVEMIAKELGITVNSVGPVRYDGTTPEEKDALATYEDDRVYIVETVYEMIEGETAPVMELSDGTFAVIRTDKITPKSYVPYEELKDELTKIWVQDKKEVQNKLKSQEILRTLQKEEKTIEQVAAENNIQVQTHKGLKRIDPAPEGSFSAMTKKKFFDTPLDTFSYSEEQNGFFIGYVEDIKLPDASNLSEETKDAIMKKALETNRNEFLLLYLGYLENKFNVSINNDVLDQIYGPGNEQF